MEERKSKKRDLSEKEEREVMRGLYKRGKTWWIRYAGPDGRMRYESTGSGSLKKARNKLLERKREVEQGKDPLAEKKRRKYTFGELIDNYLIWAERQRSIKNKKLWIKQLYGYFGNIPLNNFTTMGVEKYQTKVITSGRKPATANRHLAALKHMFRKGVEWEMVSDEILKKVRAVKFLPENNRRLRYLSAEECQELINGCSPHLKPIVITALNTGMRREEILSLEWEKHIDLRHGFILLDNTKNNERREIPLNQTLKETFRGIQRRLDSPYVFADQEGRRYRDISNSFKTACRRARIKDFTFHDLRHTFASQLIMAGVDLVTLKELLGHKDIKHTLRYSHLAPSHKINAVEKLDEKLKGSSTIQKLYNRQK